MKKAKPWWSTLTIAVFLLSWEVLATIFPGAFDSLPTFFGVTASLWDNRYTLILHTLPTVGVALAGFLVGNLTAVLLALLFVFVPPAERLLRFSVVIGYGLPLIILVPLISLALPNWLGRITISSLAVYFPTLVAMHAGLEDIDSQFVKLVNSLGGGRFDLLRIVRFRSSLPALTAGLRVSFPLAMLGAMLAELAGPRWGLGKFLQGAMTQYDANLVWSISVLASVIAAAGYVPFERLGVRLSQVTSSRKLRTGTETAVATNNGLIVATVRWSMLSLGIAILLWDLAARWAAIPQIVKGPGAVFSYLVTSSAAGDHLADLAGPLAVSLLYTAGGILVGLLCALLLAILGELRIPISGPLVALSLVSQTVPMLALVAVIVILIPSQSLAVLVITASATFFPAFTVISQGLKSVPAGGIDVFTLHGATGLDVLFKLRLPSALPALFAAVRLVAPRALLGVTLAEYLITGQGLGGLLFKARGKTEFGLICSIAAIVAIMSVLLYEASRVFEVKMMRRFSRPQQPKSL